MSRNRSKTSMKHNDEILIGADDESNHLKAQLHKHLRSNKGNRNDNRMQINKSY